MPDQTISKLVASDLPFTLYLNQRLTFDVLAALEGGFSQFRTVHTTGSGGTSTEVSGGAELGVGNAFALLGLKLGGQASRQEEKERSESTTEEIVHTPASLFARVRKDLRSRRLVQEIPQPSNFVDIPPGSFIEFEATLRRSPIVEMLTALSQLAPLVQMAETSAGQAASGGAQGQNRGRKPRRQGQGGSQDTETQINQFLRAVTNEGSQDLIAEVDGMRVVLTTEREYFIDPSMNDTIGGTFRVFGKVSRVVTNGSNEKIDLLRNTPLGRFWNQVPDIGRAMGRLDKQFAEGSFTAEVSGPALQVIPMAIFL